MTLFVTLAGAVPVTLAPVPKLQFLDNSARPLSFGCVFTYQSGTTTPLATYTNSTGSIVNSNPVVLTAGGFAGAAGSDGIWLQAGQAYTIKVVAAGGTLCSTGTTQYTIDGIGGGLTIQTSAVTFSATPSFPIQAQNQLFTITLTGNAVAQPLTAVGIIPPAWVAFQITQDGAGAHTFTWPANSIGGCTISPNINSVTTQFFLWNGTNATATGPCVQGTGPQIGTGNIVVTGIVFATGSISGSQLQSTVVTGTAPLIIASTTVVPNLNVDLLDGFDWAIPGAIGATTPNTAKFTTLVVGGSQALNGVQGSADTKIMSAGVVQALTGVPLCTDGTGGATTSGCFGNTINTPQRVILGGNVGLVANTQTIILTETVTFPSTPGNYRADVRYSAWVTAANNACAAEAIDTTNTRAFAFSGLDGNGGGFAALAGSEISTQTYAAGATPTFTLQIQCNAAQTVTVISGLFTFAPNQSTFLSVTPILSN